MVNGVPREVPRSKILGACGPSGFGLGTSLRTPFTMIPPWLFHIMSFFRLTGLVKRDFFPWRQTQPVPREYSGQCLSFAGQTLVEVNLNILVWDEERMGTEM